MKTLPVHIDLFALIILLGVVQGLLLGVFFLTGQRRRAVANRCLGWAMLAISAMIAEMFLDYSNYTFQVLAFVDFAEPFNFLAAPLFFLFIYARIHQRLPRYWWVHLIPFVIWAANSVTWLYQPTIYKYNSYIDSLHPEMPLIQPWPYYMQADFTGLRYYVNEMTLVSCLVYNVAALVVIRKAYRRAGQSLYSAVPEKLAQLRNLTVFYLILPVLIILVKSRFQEDLGDYLLACYLTFIIYTTSVFVMSGSDFFRYESVVEPVEEPKRKYEKSSLSAELEEALLGKLNQFMETEKPYLENDLSLPKLAQRLNASPHHLSQVLNDRLSQSFFDLLATYRVREAQQLLQNPGTAHLKIDEIAERVGYNSTSAFHTAFKRLAGQTPAQFRASTSSSRSA